MPAQIVRELPSRFTAIDHHHCRLGKKQLSQGISLVNALLKTDGLQVGMIPSHLRYRLLGKSAADMCITTKCAFRSVWNDIYAFLCVSIGLGAAVPLLASSMVKA